MKNDKINKTKVFILIIVLVLIVICAGTFIFRKPSNTDENISTVEQEVKIPDPTEEESNAIDIMQKYWGEDDSVYFTIDGQEGKKVEVVVRSKSDTRAIGFFEVDF